MPRKKPANPPLVGGSAPPSTAVTTVPVTAPEVRQTGTAHAGPVAADAATIEALAAAHRGKASIAAALGLSRRAFGDLLGKDEDLLLAFERGQAHAEQEIADLLLEKGRAGAIVPLLFLAKARYGWVEGQAADPARPQVTITLPDAMSEREYRIAVGLSSQGVPRDQNRGPKERGSSTSTAKLQEPQKVLR